LLEAYFEEQFMTKDPAHSSAVARHPAASLHDRFFAEALPEVAIVAARKNVYLGEGEAEGVLHYALKDIPPLEKPSNKLFKITTAPLSGVSRPDARGER
jgi:hypothetical protein